MTCRSPYCAGSPAGGNGNDGGQSWNEQLMQRVIRNREEYARRHGYDLINANAHGLVDKVGWRHDDDDG